MAHSLRGMGHAKWKTMNQELNVLLVGQDSETFNSLLSVVEGCNFNFLHSDSGSDAIAKIRSQKIDVAVVADTLSDMNGLDCVKLIVPENPFINCALESSLGSDDFHEVTEGYGVFMQLSTPPTASEGTSMVEKLTKIYQLTA